MKNVARRWLPTLLALSLALAGPPALAGDGPLYIPATVPIAAEAGIDPALLDDCPLQQDFADTLERSLSAFNPQKVPGKLDTSRKGRVLAVEIVDLANSGNGFIGYQTYIRLRGTLYQDGRKVASFQDRAQVPGEWVTACRQVRVALRGEAYYIRKWMERPHDTPKLKHFGE